MNDDEIDVCLLWQETEMHEERRRPENRGRRKDYDAFVAIVDRLIWSYRVRMAILDAGLEVE